MQNGVFDVSLTYCATWKHTPRAVRLTENILGKRELEYFVRDWKLIPSTGGRYEFEVNGEMVFSKKALGRHAEEGEIEGLFADIVQKYMDDNNISLHLDN